MSAYKTGMLAILAVSLLTVGKPDAVAATDKVTICHKPGTPAQHTLTLPQSALKAHLGHGDTIGACEVRPPCSQPPLPPPIDAGTTPRDDEPEWISEAVATLEGASPITFNPVGTPITFRLSCPTLRMDADAVIVYDNGLPLPLTALTLTSDSVTLAGGIGSGRHELHLLAHDVYGFTVEQKVVLWAGTFSIPVLVLDQGSAPVAGATVVAKLSDDPDVTAMLTTDASGRGTFTNLSNRSYNVLASAFNNQIATRPASVFDGLVTLRLNGFKPASSIDNNDFSQGTAGWEIGTAPVSIIPHVEGPLGFALTSSLAASVVTGPRTAARAEEVAARTAAAMSIGVAASDFDLQLNTSGEGQQSISRTFDVEQGYKSVTVRYRFITSEVPGGWFGSEFNDFFNVSIRTVNGGGSITAGNSMNGLGLEAFDSAGATTWFETELPVDEDGDTVQVDIAVANVADGLFDSQVVVDGVKKKKLSISSLDLRDIDNTNLSHLSASGHGYFGGSTRVNGMLTVKGARDESLEELTVQVLEGGVIATGTLAPGLTSTLYQGFGDDEEIRLDSPQLLFEIPGGELGGANQGANGALRLRVRARSSSGETAQKDFGAVTKLVQFTGGARYGGRDEGMGGDDWAKPTVATLVAGTGLTWGDFSNMNGGPFPPHGSHQTGNSVDGWFAGYNERSAATAATIIGHLNTYGARIRAVYVTFAPGSEFANAIENVTLNDGRAATSVIRNVPGHGTHFHWEVTD